MSEDKGPELYATTDVRDTFFGILNGAMLIIVSRAHINTVEIARRAKLTF